MKHIYITRSAAEEILAQSRLVGTETGGLLAGTLKQPVVFFAGSPGPRSVKKMASFSSDVVHDREVIVKARERLGDCLQYLGHWHKHPDGMTAPSGGDLVQARLIARELSQQNDRQSSIVCIITQDAPRAEDAIFAYMLEDEHSHFRALSWSLIAEDDSLAKAALQQEPYGIPADDHTHPWENQEFRFQFTPVGLARLKEEEAALKSLGFDVAVRSRSSDKRIFFELKRQALAGANEQYLCIFPCEYPFGAPRLFSMPAGVEYHPSTIRAGWNSDYRIADLLAQTTGKSVCEKPITIPVRMSHPPQVSIPIIGAVDEASGKETTQAILPAKQALLALGAFTLVTLYLLRLRQFWIHRKIMKKAYARRNNERKS